jgi:hypothetical protein
MVPSFIPVFFKRLPEIEQEPHGDIPYVATSREGNKKHLPGTSERWYRIKRRDSTLPNALPAYPLPYAGTNRIRFAGSALSPLSRITHRTWHAERSPQQTLQTVLYFAVIVQLFLPVVKSDVIATRKGNGEHSLPFDISQHKMA